MADGEFTSLRMRWNDSVTRLATIREAVDSILAIEAVFTAKMGQIAQASWDGMSYRDGWEEYDFQPLIGKPIKVFDTEDSFQADFLFPLVEHEFLARNIPYELHYIRTYAVAKHPKITVLPEREPSTTEWLAHEIDIVRRCYKKRIGKAVHHLRDIHTTWKRLNRTESPLPGFIKSSVIGMFGTPDLLPFSYSEADFGSLIARGMKPKIMTARWLAPFIGTEQANVVEQAMTVIGAAAAPRAGEPDTLDYFSSDKTNAISV